MYRNIVLKIEANFSLSTSLKHIRRIEIQIHTFLTSELKVDEQLTSLPCLFTLGKGAQHQFFSRQRRFQSRCDVMEKRKLSSPKLIHTPDSPACRVAATLTTRPRSSNRESYFEENSGISL